MHRSLSVLACLPAVALLLLGCADAVDHPGADALQVTGPAFASQGAGPPLTGAGTGVITSLEITSSRDAGGNTVQERTLEGTVSGTLEGSFVEHVRGVIHRNGTVTFQGTMYFEGTLEGCADEPGTLTATLSGRGQAGIPVTDASFRVVNQASNTIKASGAGTLHQVGPMMTYEVRYVCR
jgi:hypothetical protein